MKLFVLVNVAIFLCSTSFAQKSANYLKIHSGAEVSVDGVVGEDYKTGWGIHATDYFEVHKGGSILLTTGFTSWKTRKDWESSKANLLIVRLGYRIFAVEGLYFQIDPAGVVFWFNSASYTYAGGIGYLFNKKTGRGFDISSKFSNSTGGSWISLNLGYQFKL